MEALLAYAQITPGDFCAAFVGGVCAALVTSGPKPNAWSMFCSIVVGTGIGSYGGPVLPPIAKLQPNGFWTLAIGAGGVPITKGLILAAGKIKWPWGKNGGENGS